MDKVLINQKELIIKKIENERVVTFSDVDRLHERTEGTAGRNFRENKKHFISGQDYFELTGEGLDEFRRSLPAGVISKYASQLILITESGYLMLVKSLTDDLAWQIQRQLVNNYFRVKEIVQAPKNQFDMLRAMVDSMEEMNNKINRAEQSASLALQEVSATAEEVKRISSKVDTVVTNEDVIASDIARLLNLRSESGLAHSNLIGSIASKIGLKTHYKHSYQDDYIKVVPDEDGKGHRTYYRPAGVDKILEWFNDNKEVIYYENKYKRDCKSGKKGDIKERGYVVNGVHYKVS